MKTLAPTQAEKAARFRAQHDAPGPFIIPNPWDAGSARLLASLGFESLATSSAASSATLGLRDYGLTREQALALARQIVDATDLPVSADLENGFGDSPEAARDTVLAAAGIGLAGCSIEDAAGGTAPYELGLAVERIAAAVEAARSLPFPFVLTARAENFLRGRPDLADTIARMQAYEAAGADVLFAPGIPDLAGVRAFCRAVGKPVNVVGTMQNGAVTLAQLAEAGVKRISLAGSLHRAAMTALRDVALEAKNQGSFTFAARSLTVGEANAFLR